MPLRDAIADALGDPTLELAYWLEEGGRFVDREGRALRAARADGSGRVASIVERDGRRVGALVHDESLCDEPELVESVAAAVALALDNERLEAELRAQYDFLNTIVDTAPSLLVTIDADGVIRNLNPATVTASGHTTDDGGARPLLLGRLHRRRASARRWSPASAPRRPTSRRPSTRTCSRTRAASGS